VSTPVFPELKAKEGKFLAMKLETMPREPEVPLAPWRPNLMSNEAFAVLERRNILRGFEPAPTNQFLVDNLDPKLVGLTAKFYWDDAVESEVQKGVPPGKQETIVGEGDVVELHGVYADGTEFTQRHEFAKGKQWAYKIPKHTVIEPTIITLAIDNRDTKEARFDVTIVEDSGKSKTLPTMVIDATNKITLGEFDAKEISIAGRYQDGKAVASKKFNPSANEQVYLIPLEPVKPPTDVVVQADEGDRDEPPDGRFTVKGLLTYRNVQEMIVEADDGERRVITAGAAGEVDGGTLFAVCPLGGIVHMPETSHFYLYPRGESFDRRVKLAATSKDDLRDAIYEWSRQ